MVSTNTNSGVEDYAGECAHACPGAGADRLQTLLGCGVAAVDRDSNGFEARVPYPTDLKPAL
jgi:hypothetical protein